MLVREFPREWNAEPSGEGWLITAEDGSHRYASTEEFEALYFPVYEGKCGHCGHKGDLFGCEHVDSEYMHFSCHKCGSCTSVDVNDDSMIVDVDCVDVLGEESENGDV